MCICTHTHPGAMRRPSLAARWPCAANRGSSEAGFITVCERYVYSGTLFSLRKRRIVNFIQARPSCLRMKWGTSLLSGLFVCTRCPYFVATYTRSRIPWVGIGGGYMQVWGYMYL